MRAPLRPIVLLSLACCFFDCASLQPIPADTCGNGVVDTGEDCDGFAVACGSSFASGLAKPVSDCALSCNPAGASNACHYACDDAHPCPDGWGCSADRVCRRPSGRFASLSDAISSGADTLAIGDFDGDHKKDVLASGAHGPENNARARVVYFDSAGGLEQTYQFAAPLSSPTVRDLDGDGIDDILFGVRTSFSVARSDFPNGGSPGGFGATTGQRKRGFAPAVFPSFTIPGGADGVPVLGLPTVPGATLQTFLVGRVHDRSNAVVTAVTAYGAGGIAYQHLLPADAKITFAAAAGLVAPRPPEQDACGDIFVAYTSGTGSAVEILSPCRYDKLSGVTSFAATGDSYLSFSSPIDAKNGIHLVDLDGDGAPEVLYAGPTGSIRAAALLGNTYVVKDIKLPKVLTEIPLASGDLNSDGHIDFVTPASIVLSGRPNGTSDPDGGTGNAPDGGLGSIDAYGTVPTERASSWTSARIARIDGDDIDDLVAIVDGQPDIDFYAGLLGTALVHATISTDGAVSKIATVDIDGDHLTDVAFASQSGSTMEVDVAYARGFGPPETPRTVGRIGGVTALEALRTGTPNGLAIFTSQGDAGQGLPTGQIAVLSGDGDRQPVAPIIFTAGALAGERWQPLLVAGGRLSTTSKGIDFFALADLDQKGTRSLWLGAAQPLTPTQDLTSNGALLVTRLDGSYSRQKQFSMALGDLNGDGTDDLALLVPTTPPSVGVLIFEQGQTQPKPIVLPGNYQVVDRTMVKLEDVDGDGKRDLLTILSVDGKRQAIFALGRGDGTLGTPTVIGIDDAIAVTSIVTGGTPRSRPLAVLTKSGVSLVTISPGGAVGPPQKLTATFEAATSIVAGDIDGNGVEDLIIADNGSLRILRQIVLGGGP